MKLRLEVIVPDGCSYTTEQDALFYAVTHNHYKRITSKKAWMDKTDLTGKCGSCKYFCPIKTYGGGTCYGNCAKGRATRARTTKACKDYERL